MRHTRIVGLQLMLILMLAASFVPSADARLPDEGPIMRSNQHQLWLPLAMVENPSVELAIEDPQRTASWSTVTAPGLTLRTPPGWQSQLSGELMLGYRSITLLPPSCASANQAGCAPADEPAVPMFRAAVTTLYPNEARPSDHMMVTLEEFGYTRRNIQVRGQPGWIMEPGPTSLPGSDLKVILSLDNHEYVVEMAPSLPTISGDKDVLGLLLGTLRLDSAGAPELPPGLKPQTAARADQAPDPGPGQSIQSKIAFYARQYGNQHTNVDGCYINLFGACSFDPPYADGAHFVDCVLSLSGVQLTPSSCQRQGSVMGMQRLYNLIMANGAQPITREQVRPGDLVFISDKNIANCWGGPVTAINVNTSSGIYFAVHSIINTTPPDTATADSFRMLCNKDLTPSYEYLRMVPDTTNPTVAWQITSPITVHVDVASTLTWMGDDAGGSGVDTYVLRSVEPQGQETEIYRGAESFFDLTPRAICQSTTYTIQAIDGVGNPSPQVPLQLITTLPGDANLNGSIDQIDLGQMLVAWQISSAGVKPSAFLDVNGDGRVEAGDVLWLRPQLTNRCQ